jgi:hypothetical protein
MSLARKRWDSMLSIISTACWVIGQPDANVMRIACRPNSRLPDILAESGWVVAARGQSEQWVNTERDGRLLDKATGQRERVVIPEQITVNLFEITLTKPEPTKIEANNSSRLAIVPSSR